MNIKKKTKKDYWITNDYESEEMTVEWFSEAAIPFDKMWLDVSHTGRGVRRRGVSHRV